jgi:type IV pilus assembly protein PilX
MINKTNKKYLVLTGTNQQGAVLITSLIVLLLLTIIGVSSMRSSVMEEKMAQNTRNHLVAFEAAESALRDADRWISNLNAEPATCSTLSSCDVYSRNAIAALDALVEQPRDWWTDPDNAKAISQNISEAYTDPRYVVELRAYVPDSLVNGYEPNKGKFFFRITASGTGTSDAAQTVVESTVVKRVN